MATPMLCTRSLQPGLKSDALRMQLPAQDTRLHCQEQREELAWASTSCFFQTSLLMGETRETASYLYCSPIYWSCRSQPYKDARRDLAASPLRPLHETLRGTVFKLMPDKD